MAHPTEKPSRVASWPQELPVRIMGNRVVCGICPRSWDSSHNTKCRKTNVRQHLTKRHTLFFKHWTLLPTNSECKTRINDKVLMGSVEEEKDIFDMASENNAAGISRKRPATGQGNRRGKRAKKSKQLGIVYGVTVVNRSKDTQPLALNSAYVRETFMLCSRPTHVDFDDFTGSRVVYGARLATGEEPSDAKVQLVNEFVATLSRERDIEFSKPALYPCYVDGVPYKVKEEKTAGVDTYSDASDDNSSDSSDSDSDDSD